MRGVAEQRQAPLGPGRQRLAIVEAPAEGVLRLREDRLDHRVPAGELARKRRRVAGCRPGLARLLLGRHEAHVVDELVGAHRKHQEMLAGASQLRICPAGQPTLAAVISPRCATEPENSGREGSTTCCCSDRVDAVGADHDVGRDACAVGEGDGRLVRRPARSRRTCARCGCARPAAGRRTWRAGRRGACRRTRSCWRSRAATSTRRTCRPWRRNCGSTHRAPVRRSSSPRPRRSSIRTPFGWIATPAPTSVSSGACS